MRTRRHQFFSAAVLTLSILVGATCTILATSPASQAEAHENSPSRTRNSAKPKVAGLVVAMRGKWNLVTKDGKTLQMAVGKAISYGGILKPVTENATLKAWLINKEVVEFPGGRFSGKPIEPEANLPKKTFLESVLESMMGPVGDWVAPIARTTKNSFTDSVVLKSGNTLDITPILVRSTVAPSSSGKPAYLLFEQMPATTESKKVKVQLKDRNKVEADDIEPGLYLVTELDKRKQKTERSCFVLVAKDPEFKDVSSRFTEANAYLTKIGATQPQQFTKVLRTYMVELSQSATP
ncbi:MAG: hypothetical protein K2X29_09040 [Candidatus Obscuribacterales bacterium]|nr:hypothetical protein [Candidatus Obscuribacterales bacterium]